jgi:hypothetical protein
MVERKELTKNFEMNTYDSIEAFWSMTHVARNRSINLAVVLAERSKSRIDEVNKI